MVLMVPQNFLNWTVFMEIFFFLTQREIAMAHPQIHASNGSMNAAKTIRWKLATEGQKRYLTLV